MPRAVYNQFVPQLVLGNALTGSSGPPDFLPSWGNYTSWSFSAQYFFEVLDAATNAPSPRAATGAIHPVAAGETLWTRMAYDAPSASWALSMGVLGDASRSSAVAAPAPFMGLLAPGTASWEEPAYERVHVNSCWELYGVNARRDWPASGSDFAMRVRAPVPNGVPWSANWSNGEAIDCPGAPTRNTIAEAHDALEQNITWKVGWV